MDLDDVQAVVQVFAEVTLAQLALDVAVGGRDHANIHAFGAIHTEGPDLAVLQDAQELGLKRQGQFGDFVEK